AYRWLNVPCDDLLNCDAGCTACNLPESTPGVLVGTNAAWIGVVTCPLPVMPADNAIFCSGWAVEPDPDRAVIISGIATVPVRIDTIRFRHAVYQDGPQRVKVLFTPDMAQPLEEIADLAVPAEWADAVIAAPGHVLAPEGAPFGMFQIRFQPYSSANGGWALDEVEVVASALDGSAAGVVEVLPARRTVGGPLADVLGRPVGRERAPGVYVARNGRRLVVVD
ncbi:MAG: hypothetical protein ACK4L7_10930, partial [Flavobacteriales bacterium]